MTTPWSDTPPSESGLHHVRYKETDDEFVVWFNHETKRWWFNDDNEFRSQKYCEFGPRVLSAEETVALTAEVERLRAENAELRALIQNNNAVAEMCGLDLRKSL